jgi:hypothetical protein
VALIELVRRSTTIESIEGTHNPAILAARA